MFAFISRQGSNRTLYNLLETICIKTPKYYIFDQNAFRKLQYKTEIYQAFVETIRPYYHGSKSHYITRHHDTMNSFMTVMKQICKQHHIEVEHKLLYRHSYKEHEFYIPILHRMF